MWPFPKTSSKRKKQPTRALAGMRRTITLERLEDRRMLAPHVLTTGTGDGTVTVGVDGFGGFGSAQGTDSTNAVYDPVGPIGPAGTTFQSFVALRMSAAGTGPRTILQPTVTTPNPVVTGTTTTGTSTFTISGLSFQLNQAVTPLTSSGVQNGSLLTQIYNITNTTATSQTFELVRYIDGDLAFDGSIADGGGRIITTSGQEVLFETDAGGDAETATTFVGIEAIGGTAVTLSRYEIASFSGLMARITAGNALTNTIQGDGNGDGFIDPGAEYDVTLALRNVFTLAPGASVAYVTRTIFGTGAPGGFLDRGPSDLYVATGAETGNRPLVQVFDPANGDLRFAFLAYEASFIGGVRVATGDVTGDGVPDVVTVPGPGRPAEIRVWNGDTGTEIVSMRVTPAQMGYGSYNLGLHVGVGDVTGDGLGDIVVGASRGAGIVKVFQNRSNVGQGFALVRSFDAFQDLRHYQGGVGSIAVADIDGDTDGNARADVLIGSGSGTQAEVRVIDVAANKSYYSPNRRIVDSNPNARGGISVAVGDINADGILDIVTGAGYRGGSFIRVYDGRSTNSIPLFSFRAFADTATPEAPVRVQVRDFDGLGLADIYATMGADGDGRFEVRTFRPLTGDFIDQFFAESDLRNGGVTFG